MHPDDRFHTTPIRIARTLGITILVASLILLAYSLLRDPPARFASIQLAYVALVAAISLVVSETGRVRLGFTLFVVSVELLLLAEPYVLLPNVERLLIYLVTSTIGLIILIALSALFLHRLVTIISFGAMAVNLAVVLRLTQNTLLIDNIPYVVAAMVVGGVLIGYLQTINTRHRLELDRAASRAQEAANRAEAMVEEKNTLLREVYHRVKNNLQVVISLLSLQAAKLKDPEARTALQAVRGRVSSMALVHETLHNSTSLSSVDARTFIEKLVGSVARLHEELRDVRIVLEVEPLMIESAPLVSLGLILNELCSNSYEHAFTQGAPGTIAVSLRRVDDNRIRVTFTDDGAGLPEGFEPSRSGTLGMSLVYQLSKQLDGSITADASRKALGTSWILEFPG
ncbi:sensor histidine kinase [Salinispira pacifica]